MSVPLGGLAKRAIFRGSRQLISNYKRPKDELAIIEANKIAAGYVFGFHDSFVCKLGLLDEKNPKEGLKLIRTSYQNIFGDKTGFDLFNLSISLQQDPDFEKRATERRRRICNVQGVGNATAWLRKNCNSWS
jgi:hypothetical protein